MMSKKCNGYTRFEESSHIELTPRNFQGPDYDHIRHMGDTIEFGRLGLVVVCFTNPKKALDN